MIAVNSRPLDALPWLLDVVVNAKDTVEAEQAKALLGGDAPTIR